MKKVISTLFIVAIFGCNNSSNNETVFVPTDPNTVFNLYEPYYFVPNLPEKYTLKGSNNYGEKYECQITSDAQYIVTYNNMPADPVETITILKNITLNIETISVNKTYYSFPATGGFFNLGFMVDGKLFNPLAGKVELDEKATIGSIGNTGSYKDVDGNTISGKWKLEDAGNNTAYLYEINTTKDNLGNTIQQVNTVSLINTKGEKLSITTKISNLQTGLIIDLSTN